MKEYKFRIWDVDNEEMIYQGSNTDKVNSVIDVVLHFTDKGIFTETREYGKKEYKSVTNFLIMPYIDKEDSKGVEIYKDDIIQTDDCMGVVVWDNESLGYYLEVCEDGDLLTLDNWEELDVVGNIHENLDLIDFPRLADKLEDISCLIDFPQIGGIEE